MEKSPGHQMLMQQLENGNVIQGEQSFGIFCCLLCSCSISGQSQAESHVIGAQHAKKLLEKSFGAQTYSKNPELNTSSSEDFNCQLCSLEFNGPIPFNQHLQSKNHRKKELGHVSIKQEEISAPLQNMTSKSIQTTLKIANTDINPSPDSSTSQNTYCELCSVELTGKIPMEHHLIGKAHLKKLAMQSFPMKQEQISTIQPNLTSTPILTTLSRANTGTNTSPDSTTSPKTYCELCSVELTGKIPMEHHLMGKVHQKKLAMQSQPIKQHGMFSTLPNITSTSIQKPTPQIAKTGINLPPHSLNEENTCKLCNIELSGRIPMEAHLRGKSHQRKLLYFGSSTKRDSTPKLQGSDSLHVNEKSIGVCSKRHASVDSQPPAEKSPRDASPKVQEAESAKPESILTIDEHEPVPDFF